VLSRHVLEHGGVRTQTCPQCGVNPAHGPTLRRHTKTPRFWYFLLVPSCFLWAPAFFVVAGIALATRKTVSTSYTLCSDCDRADRRAQGIRGLTAWSGLFAPLIAFWAGIGLELSGPGIGALVGGSFVAGLTAAAFGHVKTKTSLLDVRDIERAWLRLRASPTWKRVLREEHPEALGLLPQEGELGDG
jgi:hypothetical protein